MAIAVPAGVQISGVAYSSQAKTLTGTISGSDLPNRREAVWLEGNGHTALALLRRKSAGDPDWRIPFRPDHGHEMLDDVGKPTFPGYPLIGRMPEVERTVQILCRRSKNNPLYVGEPGVGKTAIVEGLARPVSP